MVVAGAAEGGQAAGVEEAGGEAAASGAVGILAALAVDRLEAGARAAAGEEKPWLRKSS